MPRRLSLLALVSLATSLAYAADRGDDDEEAHPAPAAPAYRMKTEIAFDAMSVAAEMGVTVGGAQDIGYFRERVAAGEVPHPNVLTAEGLFGEHDLPIQGRSRCDALMCPVGEATPARLVVGDDTRWIAQLGFDSGIDPATWRRAPVNLVAVVDVSGSMSGAPIEAVKASLREVVSHLGPDDQVSIVVYGSDVRTHLPPTPASRSADLLRGVNSMAINGSTNMEAGLIHGFALAREAARRFDGTSRVMLFTDERPNTGRTDAQSFMGLAQAASHAGVGMTTIGVGAHFGAELASQISAVRGGNLFFFPDAAKMRETFRDELDTMVSELAYDLELVVTPAPGTRITGLWGIPGDAVQWTPDGRLRMQVQTLFLSRDEGAIYFGFGPSGSVPPTRLARVGEVSMAYTLRDGTRPHASVDLDVTAAPQPGLVRGALLVDTFTAIRAATALHHERNDQEGAWRLMDSLAQRYATVVDPSLSADRALVSTLTERFARLSGRLGEAPAAGGVARHAISGLPEWGVARPTE